VRPQGNVVEATIRSPPPPSSFIRASTPRGRTQSPRPIPTRLTRRAFSTLGRPLAPITQDVCAFCNDHAVYDDFGGVAVELDEGERIAIGKHKAAIPAGRPASGRFSALQRPTWKDRNPPN
jgi:hypothetical protein